MLLRAVRSSENQDDKAIKSQDKVEDVDEIIRIRDQFYILASSLGTQTETRSLKSGETFAVFDDLADIQPVGLGQQGLYHRGTRFLSRLELRVADSRPLLLSSTVKEDNERAGASASIL